MKRLRLFFATIARWCFGEAIDDVPDVFRCSPCLQRRRDLAARFIPELDVEPPSLLPLRICDGSDVRSVFVRLPN